MADTEKYNISFDPIGKSVKVLPGINILEAARLAGINITATCGGNGGCGKCKVIINNGNTSSPNANEKRLLTEDELSRGYRLACSTFPLGDVRVNIPEKTSMKKMKLQLDGQMENIPTDPVVMAVDIQLQPPSLEDPTADMDKVVATLGKTCKLKNPLIDIAAARQLSPFIRRRHEWKIAVLMRLGEIIGFIPHGHHPVGLAVDLGTTKIAAYLMDLNTGKELASTGSINPQSVYGDDLMSRLDKAVHATDLIASEAHGLTTVVRECLNSMILQLTEKARIEETHVADICIVGNTAMTHLLLDLPVDQLATSPYIPSTTLPLDVKARELGINAAPGAYVHIVAGIGGFVGADHVAMILGTSIDRKEGITLGVDIGTNTEIVFAKADQGTMISTSCPSGPALEGAHVMNGMRAADGAIEAVKITGDAVECRTIGNEPAIGLCGSGIIDAISEMYRMGIINDKGRFNGQDRWTTHGKYGREFHVAPGQNGEDVVISQKDIAEIQLAKGAIYAAIKTLMEATETPYNMVNEVIIAGAFGSFINITNTLEIGLIPFFPNATYRQVGNGAAVGSKMALLSHKERIRASKIAENTNYLELTTHKHFSKYFAQGMKFPAQKVVNHELGTVNQ